ncbi:MAG: hypothetical protein KAY22_27220 [Rhizorhabdus sp.]|uniref:hypothetical protein n=1 Tax=Rhizorhabdus sp. TaxID=1968843 RepID=UPI001B505659|nr:hypothetical protein [Rhizorhabdus sp.]MBP8235985.1 hypothetical protein [Rhizorhabdus sp.]
MSFFDLVKDGSRHELGNYLRDNYKNNPAEIERRKQAKKRDDFYAGEGDEYIIGLIAATFQDPENRKMRTALVSHAKWNNVIARVVNEKASVYKLPARRRVNGEPNQARYQALLDAIAMDQLAQAIDRKLALHEDCWVQYRLRVGGDGEVEPTVDVVSPAGFYAVCSPTDKTSLVGVIVDAAPAMVNAPSSMPHYYAVSPDEAFFLDAEMNMIESTLVKPTGGRAMSGFLATTRLPGTKESGGLLARAPCADLVAAHESVWFEDVLLLKESTSLNNQTYLTGDLSMAAQGQVADTTREATLPEGVSVQSVNRGVDLSQYRDTADHILERGGANHGLPPSVLHHRDSSSGAEIHLRRIPLHELREERIPFLRRVERRLVTIMAQVNAARLPEFAFDPAGWGIDFAEVQQPLTEDERDRVFENRRRLLMTDTIEEERRRNPDVVDDAEAWKRIDTRLDNETRRVLSQRALMQIGSGIDSSVETPMPDQAAVSSVDSMPSESIEPAPAVDANAAPPADATAATSPELKQFNGAQITSIVELVRQAAAGEVSRVSAIAILRIGFAMSDEEAAEIVGPEDFKPTATASPAPSNFGAADTDAASSG